MNVNSFYNYFYAQATTLDTEELVLTSARSLESDLCGVYRDRDAMRWSLPAVLQINWAQARKMLIYAFTTQLGNVGTQSRFIDGIGLEPGLALDQLCAPVRALQMYLEITGDMSILFDRRVQTGVNTITRHHDGAAQSAGHDCSRRCWRHPGKCRSIRTCASRTCSRGGYCSILPRCTIA